MVERQDTLVIRADADRLMGAGHVMRCLALAEAWIAQSGAVLFCSYIESAAFRERITREGFELSEPGYRPEDTVAQLLNRGLTGCWVAVDGYHFGPEWQEGLMAAGFRVLVMDDGAKLTRYAAKVIVAPEHDASPAAYPAPSSSLILAGPRYRLLDQGFVGLPRPARPAGVGVEILVSFGGADSANATRAAVLGLDAALGPGDMVRVVLGPLNRHEESVREALVRVRYRHELFRDVEGMAGLYARSDLAVSAAGGAAWEMAAAGLPTLLVAVADNQKPSADFLARAGAAKNLGDPGVLASEGFPEVVRGLLDDPARRAAMVAAGPLACDGRGARRVCDMMRVLTTAAPLADGIRLRRADPADMEQIYRLANDPVVRENAFTPEPIALVDHARWYATRLASPDTVFFVLDLDGAVLAVARYDRVEDEAEIDVAVHPAFRGRGLGERILRGSVPAAFVALSVSRLRAVVFARNAASRRCFTRAGFREAALARVKGRDCAVFLQEVTGKA